MRLALKSLSRSSVATAARSPVKPNFAVPSGSVAAMATYAENVTELIGNTPMVKLNRVVPKESVAAKVLVKLEMQNPGGSIKDRIALSMIEEAEKRGGPRLCPCCLRKLCWSVAVSPKTHYEKLLAHCACWPGAYADDIEWLASRISLLTADERALLLPLVNGFA